MYSVTRRLFFFISLYFLIDNILLDMTQNALFSMPLAWWRNTRSSLRSKGVREGVLWTEVVFFDKN